MFKEEHLRTRLEKLSQFTERSGAFTLKNSLRKKPMDRVYKSLFIPQIAK